LKTISFKMLSMPKIAVLATGLTAAVLVATVSPAPSAQARVGYTEDCSGCHAAGGSVTATPSSATPAAGAAYTVALAFTGGSSPAGFWISGNGANVTGSSATSATMTAPTAAGTYTYTAWVRSGVVASTTYSITVGAAPTTVPPTTVPPTTVPPTTVPPTTVPPTTVPPTTVPPTTVPPTTVPPTTVPPTTDPTHTPGAPTGVTATSGNGQATVSWTAPKNDGGLPIVGYLVVANDGEVLAVTEGAETTTTVTGLTNGKSYTFTVIAFNEGENYGSPESAASNAVTPSGPAASATTTGTTPVVVAGTGAAVIPVGAPDTGAGGAFNR
jgi:Fibronectin type III domain